MSDFRIANIQRRLRTLGYYPEPLDIDGDFGPGTESGINAVLRLVEQAKGITAPAAPAPAAVALPAAYAWLNDVAGLPRHLVEALKLYGTVEVPGAADSPIIMGWRDELRAAGIVIEGYSADSVPWCGLYAAVVMLRARRDVVDKPLWALNWSKWGEDGGQPELGDLLTFTRPTGGHVAFYIGEDSLYYHVLGGNQSDRVNFMRIAKTRMHACRQPPYRTKPASVRPMTLAPTGTVSRNEA